jgi:hypothetical protein
MLLVDDDVSSITFATVVMGFIRSSSGENIGFEVFLKPMLA